MSAAVPANAPLPPRTSFYDLLREYDVAQDELVMAAISYVTSGIGDDARHATAKSRWDEAREAARRRHETLAERLTALDRLADRSEVR